MYFCSTSYQHVDKLEIIQQKSISAKHIDKVVYLIETKYGKYENVFKETELEIRSSNRFPNIIPFKNDFH